jgi:hypothetical protein
MTEDYVQYWLKRVECYLTDFLRPPIYEKFKRWACN